MTEATLKSLIEETLEIPVFDAADSIIYPSATIEFDAYVPGIFGDGKAKARHSTVQLDLWYTVKTERDSAVGQLLTALESLPGTTSPEIETYYDTTAQKFRATFKFETI